MSQPRSPRRRIVPTNVLVPEAHRDALKRLAARTRISQSEFLREAVGDLLDKYRAELQGAGDPTDLRRAS